MKRQNLFISGALSVILLWGLISLAARPSYAQSPWQRIGLEGGGVAEDIQYLCHDGATETNYEVWSACMDAGLYKMNWSNEPNNGFWGNWVEYLPGRGMYGVDAIEKDNQIYMLGAARGRGLWFGSGYQSPPQAEWNRPNSQVYPDAWNEVSISDAAFYRNSSGFANPQQEFFVQLSQNITTPTTYKAGIYRWCTSPVGFVRIDPGAPDSRYFMRFYRERNAADHPDVLYARLPAYESPSLTYNGGLYKIQGSTYGSGLTCTLVPISSYTIKDVYGFNQWKDGGTYHSYLLAKWHEAGVGDHVSVFHTTQLPTDDDPQWDKLEDYDTFFDLGGEMDWDEYGVSFEGGVIGRPDGSGNAHRLYIAPGATYGVIYDYTGDQLAPVQINGPAGGDPYNPDLKRWYIHTMMPDYDHMGSYTMVGFVGTHKQGVWRFKHSVGPPPTLEWQHLSNGYFGADLRDIKIIPSDRVAWPARPKGVRR